MFCMRPDVIAQKQNCVFGFACNAHGYKTHKKKMQMAKKKNTNILKPIQMNAFFKNFLCGGQSVDTKMLTFYTHTRKHIETSDKRILN